MPEETVLMAEEIARVWPSFDKQSIEIQINRQLPELRYSAWNLLIRDMSAKTLSRYSLIGDATQAHTTQNAGKSNVSVTLRAGENIARSFNLCDMIGPMRGKDFS